MESSHDLTRLMAEWRRQMAERGVADESTLDELESHLLDQVDELIENGLTERQAFFEAAARLGHEDLLATEYRKARDLPLPAREPVKALGWSGSLAWSYLTVAWRQLRRHKGYALINIVGLTVSLAAALLIFLYVADELSYDRFHKDNDRIYRVLWQGNQSAAAVTPAPTARLFVDEVPQVEGAVRLEPMEGLTVRRGEGVFSEDGFIVADSGFFSFFGHVLLAGDAESVLREPYSIVLTEERARRFFGEANPVGKELVLSGLLLQEQAFTVTGVMENLPKNTSYPFDGVFSISSLPNQGAGGWWHTFIRIREGDSVQEIEAYLDALSEKAMPPTNIAQVPGVRIGYALQPLSAIHLYGDNTKEYAPERIGKAVYVWVLLAIGLFVLVLACLNYVNLATARAATRAKEVGIRRVVGSSRGQLVRQHLTESVLLVLVASALALGLAHLLLPGFNEFAGKEISIGLLSRWYVAPALMLLALLVGVLSGLYPAVYLTRYKPALVLKGSSKSGRGMLHLRRGLVVFQFAVSVGLIISAMFVYLQARFMQEKELGFNKERVLVVELPFRLGEKASAFEEEVRRLSRVEETGHASGHPGYANNKYFGPSAFFSDSTRAAQPTDSSSGGVPVIVTYASEGLIPTLQMNVVDGRNFESGRSTEKEAIILNETAARALGYENPIGERAYMLATRWRKDENGEEIREEYVQAYEVIGVVQDFHFRSLHEAVVPMGFRWISSQGSSLLIRLRPGDPREAVGSIEAVWKGLPADLPFVYNWLDEEYDAAYRTDERFGMVVAIFAGLAILIACLGIVGLSAFAALNRRKEIGIRKVLGATAGGIARLLAGEFAGLTLTAFVVAVPLAYIGVSRWLESFAYRIEIGPAPFLLAGAVALGLALIAVSFHAVRAAFTNPADTLRYE